MPAEVRTLVLINSQRELFIRQQAEQQALGKGERSGRF